MHPQPEPANAFHHRCQIAANGGDLRCQQIRLLGTHALCRTPAQAQHKGGDTRLCHDLFQDLPYRNFTVQDRRVSADHADPHVTHCHKIPHIAASGLLHGAGPFLRQHSASFRRVDSLTILTGHREPHIAAALPVDPNCLIDCTQNIRQKRQSPQQRYAIGMIRLRVHRCKQQQVLIG